jgi:restriction endonuclease S subunit
MSEWQKMKLGELCDFINGGAWSDKEYTAEGIPVTNTIQQTESLP